MSRAVLALPGKGAYTASALGSLAGDPLLGAVDERRAEHGLLPLAELDAAEVFVPGIHLRPANAAPLIYLGSLRDADLLADEHELVAVVGNGLGWCTALAVGGVLDRVDGLRLVQEIGLAQELASAADDAGGQLLYPMTDTEWHPIPERATDVAAALSAVAGAAWPSIELGPYVVLAGSASGLEGLTRALPPITIGKRQYPLRLALSGPDHSPLAAPVAAMVAGATSAIAFGMPRLTLIDGRGARHTPWSADPSELADYTRGDYLVTTYRFATSVRVALREYAPDVILLPGPGETLGGVVGGIIVVDGYRGIRNRAALAAEHAARPLIVSSAS